MLKLSIKEAESFRNQLRDAREKAQKDAEAFRDVAFALERLGGFLMRRHMGKQERGNVGLGRYRPFILELATHSPLFYALAGGRSTAHVSFVQLYELVLQARNSRMHGGPKVRHATKHAIDLALVLENALMKSCGEATLSARDFMVRNPICAEMWQPLSWIRQTMLENSFSSLPVDTGSEGKPAWKLVCETAAAHFLQRQVGEFVGILDQSLGEAAKSKGGTPGQAGDYIELVERAETVQADAPVQEVISRWTRQYALPVLVTRDGTEAAELLGILTPYDLL